MKKSFQIILISFFLYSINTKAQKLLPFKENNKWGAIDLSGKEIISPTYDYMEKFENGISVIKKSGKYGLLNEQGQEIIKTQYDKILKTENNSIIVCQDGQCGLSDNTGQEITEPLYVSIEPLNNKLYRIYKDTKFGVIDLSGKELLKPEYDRVRIPEKDGRFIRFSKNDKHGLINSKGEIIAEAIYDAVEIRPLSARGIKGKAITLIEYSKDGSFISKKEFPNQAGLTQIVKANLRAKQRKMAKEDPSLLNPRWTQDLYRYKLTNAFGRNLLGNKEFFDIGTDQNLKLTLAREYVGKDTIKSYLINNTNAKIIFSADVKDMIISDYNKSKYARVTIDTLWDGLITKEGTIKNTVSSGGKEVRFANMGNYNFGLAWVFDGKKYGFVNTDAKVTIPIKYDIVSDFSEGYAIAKKNGKFGAINKSGKEVIPFIYDGIAPPQKGLLRVKKGKGRAGKWGAVNISNQTIVPFEYGLIGDFSEGKAKIWKAGKYGLINTKGRVIVTPKIDVDEIFEFKNGIAKVGRERSIEKINGRPQINYKYYGYINAKGEFVIPADYHKISDFETVWKKQSGLAKITHNNKIGFVNYKGQLVLKPEYTDVSDFEIVWLNNKGISKVKKGVKIGYINHRGEEVLLPEYDFVDDTYMQVWKDSSGIAKASKGGKFGYIDVNGVPIIHFQYDYISDFSNDIAIVRQGKLWGAINKKRQVIIDVKYAGVRFLKGSDNKLLEVYANQHAFYYLDNKGEIVKTTFLFEGGENNKEKEEEVESIFSPKFEYETQYDQYELAVVVKDGKRGLVNKFGKLVTKLKYISVGPFNDGLALVKLAHKDRSKELYGYINPNGEEVIAPQFKLAGLFSNGKAAIKKGVWGYINNTGQIVIKPQFQSAEPFSDGKAIVNGNIVINEKGEKIGTYTLPGIIKGGFISDRAIIETTSGMFHIRPDGQPAYFNKADEVTAYNGNVAFVKTGEVWELSRYNGINTSKVKFNRTNKNAYIKKYGKNRTQKNVYGQITKDMSWELVKNGVWKMIDKNGKRINDLIFTQVEDMKDGTFRCKVERLFGIANLQGRFLCKPQNEIILKASENIFRVESGGKVGYIKSDGTWVRAIK